MLFCLAINRSWKQKIEKIYVLREEEEEEEEEDHSNGFETTAKGYIIKI